VAPFLFMIFWFWVIVAGLKRVCQQVGKWLYTPWGNNDDLFPTLRGTVGQTWEADEYRHLSSLAAQAPVPAIPDVAQDMERALERERHMAGQLSRDITEWQNAIDQLKRGVEEWTERAALALAKGRNDLGRAAIVERQRNQQRIAELERDVAEMRRLLTTHASDIQSLEAKLSGIYRRNRMLETRLHAAESSTRTRQLLYGEQVKDALSRFEALERAADKAEGEADSLALGAEPAPDMPGIEAEFAAAAGFGRKRIAP
jgi:phage shock protein A